MVEAWIVTLLVNVLPLRSETLLPARVRNVVVFERPSPPSSLSSVSSSIVRVIVMMLSDMEKLLDAIWYTVSGTVPSCRVTRSVEKLSALIASEKVSLRTPLLTLKEKSSKVGGTSSGMRTVGTMPLTAGEGLARISLIRPAETFKEIVVSPD